MKALRVFISSPSDVKPERELVERVLARLSAVWRSHLRFEAVRWERSYYQAARSFQQSIEDMAVFDVVLGVLWKRIGSPLPPDLFARDDGSAYQSGTIYELESAIASSEKSGKPAVFIFRKREPVTFSAANVRDEETQYNALIKWWNSTIRDDDGYYRRGYQTFATADELEHQLESLLEQYAREAGFIPHGLAWDVDVRGSPYPGLIAYDSSYAEVFFGRSLSVAAAQEGFLSAARNRCPAMFVVGPSGSGKSSLVRAGLLPGILNAGVGGVDLWRQTVVEPTPDLAAGLAERLYSPEALPELKQSPAPTPSHFAALLRRSPDDAAQTVRWAVGRAQSDAMEATRLPKEPQLRVLVFLDQLETVLDSEHCGVVSDFIRALVYADTIWIIGTFRSDRYASFQLVPSFSDLRRNGLLFDLPPPGASEIGEIIRGPAHAAGLEFDKRDGFSLADELSKAVTEADALPLLQMTLARLYRSRSGNLLTFDAYDSMLGFGGAIAAHAEEVFATVSENGQSQLDSLLRLLVADVDESGLLSLKALRTQSLSPGTPLEELVVKLTEGRLLVSGNGEIRLSHEALLRNWSRAASSPAMNPEAIRLRRQLTLSLRDWIHSKAPDDLLQPGTALSQAERITREHPGAFPPEIDRFVFESATEVARKEREERERQLTQARRERWLRRGAAIAAVVFAVLACAALVSYEVANKNLLLAVLARAEDHFVHLQPAHTKALIRNLRPNSILARAGEILVSPEDVVRIETLESIVERSDVTPEASWRYGKPVTAAGLGGLQRQLAFGFADGAVVLTQPEERHPSLQLLGHPPGRVEGIQFDKTGTRLLSYTNKEVRVWDLTTHSAHSYCDGEDNITGAALDPGGNYVAWSTKDGRVVVVELNGRARISWQDHARWTTTLAIAPDGSALASAGEDGTIVIRRRAADASWGEPYKFETGITDTVSLAFSRNADRIAAASLAGAVKIWPIEARTSEFMTVRLPPEKRFRVAFSPDGSLFAVASWDGTVHLFRADSMYPDREAD